MDNHYLSVPMYMAPPSQPRPHTLSWYSFPLSEGILGRQESWSAITAVHPPIQYRWNQVCVNWNQVCTCAWVPLTMRATGCLEFIEPTQFKYFCLVCWGYNISFLACDHTHLSHLKISQGIPRCCHCTASVQTPAIHSILPQGSCTV